MAQIGNKQNAYLNGEWGAHVRKSTGDKRRTSKTRRRFDRAITHEDTTNRLRWRGR